MQRIQHLLLCGSNSALRDLLNTSQGHRNFPGKLLQVTHHVKITQLMLLKRTNCLPCTKKNPYRIFLFIREHSNKKIFDLYAQISSSLRNFHSFGNIITRLYAVLFQRTCSVFFDRGLQKGSSHTRGALVCAFQ